MRRLAPLALAAAILVLPAAPGGADPGRETYAIRTVERGPVVVRSTGPLELDGTLSRGVVAYRSTDTGGVELVVGPDGGRLVAYARPTRGIPPLRDPPPRPTAPGAWPVVPADNAATERFVFDDDRVFGSVASADPAVYDVAAPTGFLAAVVPGKETKFDVSLPAAQPDGTVVVRLRGFRTHVGPIRVAARWADLELGTAVAPAGVGPVDLTFSVRADLAPSGRSTLFLEDRSEVVRAADPFDSSDDVGTLWIDRVEVEVPVGPHDGLRMAVGDGVFARVPVVEADALPLVTWTPGGPPAGASQWVAIATPPLLEGARRLAAHRAAHGLTTAVVSTADLAPPGDGATLAREVRRVATSGARYVVLVGDADRDRGTTDTIPTRYARTVYNGATATDRPYVTGDDGKTRAVLGRLPFTDPAALDAYVARVVRTETTPPADATRRAVKFITSEGRFGAQIDALLENLFTQVVATHIPASYDVTVTFARAKSEFGWPAAQFNDKVIDELNDGSLFFTYVGHGWWNGFDDLRVDGKRYPILKNQHVDRVVVRGTPPAMFVIACTTALFDDPDLRSIGERLLDRPDGPLAYWGATRVCHPAWNSVVGREIAKEMFAGTAPRRLGDVLEAAVTSGLGPVAEKDMMRRVIESGAAAMLRQSLADLARLKVEGAAMYALLGDPALALPLPKPDLAVAATRVAEGVEVVATGPLPDGTDVTLTVEVPRTTPLPFERDPAWAPEETMRRRHARANDKTLATVVVQAKAGAARAVLPVAETRRNDRLLPTASATVGLDVHVGTTELPAVR